MSLSCSYGDWDDAPWYFTSPEDFSKLETNRRQRCKSCKTLIDKGIQCLEFKRWRLPNCDYEEKRFGYGTEIRLASWYHCEMCGEIFLNLEAAGFCNQIDDDMRELMKEYQEMTGFLPVK